MSEIKSLTLTPVTGHQLTVHEALRIMSVGTEQEADVITAM